MLRTDLFGGVNEPVDPRNLSDLEKMHIPVIEAPASVVRDKRFDVTIEVGAMLSHPNEHQHSIQFVELYVDDALLARVDMAAVRTEPRVTLCATLANPAKELRARAFCNIHGMWAGRKPIAVTAP